VGVRKINHVYSADYHPIHYREVAGGRLVAQHRCRGCRRQGQRRERNITVSTEVKENKPEN